HRYPRVHESEHSAAHARHRSRAIRFHYFAGYADGVTKIIFTRHHRLERTFRQGAVADLAPAGAAKPSSFANSERRGTVMQQKPLRLFAADVGIDHLLFLDWREGGQCEGLGSLP